MIWPLRTVRARLAAFLWTARGRRALVRGDPDGAILALEHALRWRPSAFGALLLLARGYLRTHDTWRAHRTLARAREANPLRFARQAPHCLVEEGVDRDTLGRVLGVGPAGPAGPAEAAAGARVPATTKAPSPTQSAASARSDGGAARSVAASSLPFGDCQDLDEYARFQAMPPISRSEMDTLDWDRILEDLLED